MAEESLVAPVLQTPLEPSWPADASPTLGLQRVRLELQIDTQGTVIGTRILEGEAPFTDAAITTALQMHFLPATLQGNAVNSSLEWTFSLRPPISSIVGTYHPGPDDPQHRSLDVDQARLLPGTLNDPLRALQLLPGTVRMPLDSGWLLVRGGSPRDTAILVDGLRVPNLQHMGGFTSILHPSWFSRVDFWPGAAPARDGRAISGVVEVETLPSMPALKVRGGANLALADVFATVPLPTKTPMALGVAFRRSYLDSVVGLVANADAFPSFWDWQARVDLADAHVFAFGYEDQVKGTTPTGNQVLLKTATQRVQGHIPLGLFRLSPWLGRDLASVEVVNTGEVREDEGDGFGLRLERPEEPSQFISADGGMDLWVERHSVRADALRREAWMGSPEAWLGLRVGGGERQFRLGVRTDTLLVESQLPRVTVSPRASGSWPLLPGLTVVGDLGLLHQPPPSDLLIGPPDGATLEMEEALSTSAGLHWFQGPWKIEVDGYFRSVGTTTAYESDGSLGQGQARAYGVETWLRLQQGPFDGWVAYTWSRSLRREEAGLPWQPSTIDQPHTLVVVGKMELGHDWSISGRFRYSSGLPTPAAVPEVVDLLTSEVVHLDPDASRLSAFHSLDLKAAKTVHLRHGQVEVYLDIQNIYNHRIPEPVLTTLSDAYPTWVMSLPILPLLGLEGQWP